jgi:hypothetical protein
MIKPHPYLHCDDFDELNKEDFDDYALTICNEIINLPKEKWTDVHFRCAKALAHQFVKQLTSGN